MVITDKTFKVGQQFMITPSATFDDDACAAKSTPPRLSIKVIVVPFQRLNDSRYHPVAPEESPAGYSDVLWTQNESSCSSSTCLRPTGIA
ncbi:hypothetical protein NEMBOFW57_001219 [Staphylotrichum longicolle]|uniref:Pyrroloquinoline quinone-dependent pyranose dehydrogenase beta-propeller domain-containing protein n=1 Tax=Staphylotrichum longicolle TaxID=669026 RepID=A0AAD4F124_9PEZI|nr:hypothetical protein NEMBOFW57_001219 [Staphylotrichum longicolle]